MIKIDYYNPTYYCRTTLDIQLNGIRSMVVSGRMVPDYALLPSGATLLSDRWHYLLEGHLKALPLLQPKRLKGDRT